MTQPIASATPSKKRSFLVYFLVLISIVLIGGFLFMRMGVDKALVQKKLDEYIAVLKDKGREQGRDIDVTYGELEVTGGLMERHVLVHDLVMTVKALNPRPVSPDGSESIAINTEALAIYPKAMDLSKLRLSLPHPIEVVDGNDAKKSLLKITADSPLEATVEQTSENGVPHMKVAHTAPSKIDFTYLREKQAQGEEDKTPTLVPVYDTIHMTIALSSTIATNFATDDSELGEASVSFKQITTTPESAPEGVVTIAGIEGRWSSALNADKVNVIENQIHVGPITASNDVLPYAPMSLKVDVSYIGATADKEGEPRKDPSFTLKEFALTTKDSSLTAAASFTASPTDILPTGKASIKLTNAPFVRDELQKHGILNAENEAWVSEMIQKITGTAFNELKDMEFAVERAQGGAFKIGNSTFEEVFAIVLKHALKINPPADVDVEEGTAPHTPKLPAPDKPKSAPIAVPDNGVRG